MLLSRGVTLVCATAAFALADCVDGMRKLTPAESNLVQNVAAALAAALPDAPEGWQRSGEPKVVEPVVCKGQKPGDFSLSVSLAYYIKNPPKRQEYPEEAEIRRLSQEIETLERTPEEVRKRINEVQARQSEKRRAAKAAERAGNREEYKRLWAEADSISSEADKIRAEYLASVAPQINERKAKIEELRARIPTYSGTKVAVRVIVNGRRDLPVPGKGLNADVLVWGSPTPAPIGTTVSNVFLEIEGWPEYREVILAKIDQARLAALVR